MKTTKQVKKQKVSPKKGSQRITTFFQTQGSAHAQPGPSKAKPDSETTSRYFEDGDHRGRDESVSSQPGSSSKSGRLSLGKHRSTSLQTNVARGNSLSSNNKEVSSMEVNPALSTKRKSDHHIDGCGDLCGKRSKTDLKSTDDCTMLNCATQGIGDKDDETVLKTNSCINENQPIAGTTSLSTRVTNDGTHDKTAEASSSLDNSTQAAINKHSKIAEVALHKRDSDKSVSKIFTTQTSSSCDNHDVNVKNIGNESNNTQEVSEQQEVEEEEYRIPYYLENFVTILNYVMTDDFYTYLFNDEDREIVTSFQNLTENGQKLYVRLFGRQFRWLRKGKIVYAKISEDLTSVLDELVEAKLIDDENSLHDLPDILRALPAPDLKTLGKSLRLNTSLVREELISAVIKHCSKTNISSFFKTSNSSSQTGGTDRAVVQRAKKLLGPCYRLCKAGRSVFMRITMLFGVHRTQGEEDERGAGQTQLFQMLMSNIGKVKYPEYTINRKTKIFESRDSLQSFSAALQVEVEMVDALDRKDYDAALEYYEKAKEKLRELRENDAEMRHDRCLPPFLSVYTSAAVYTRVLSQGVELFQFKKQYTEAIDQLKELIQQEVYHLDYRGRWYERLVLNLDHHLKKPAEALDYIKAGLTDPNIRLGHRYGLFQRAQKICHAPSNKKLRKRWQEFSDDVMALVAEAPKVHIKGKRLDHVAPGGYAMFISEDSFNKDKDEVTFLKRVEDVALNYYKEQGYTEGIHAEGGIISLLFNLVMWDIIFCDEIPDVFYNMYQTLPLDLYTEDFYLNRKAAIDTKLRDISGWKEEELCSRIETLWTEHYGTLCVGINWELFSEVDQLTCLCRCMGVSVLTAVFDRMAKDRRFTRSGVPDLTVWNPLEKTFKIVEVKGPGDRLSTKQILWLDYLINVGVKAEVCHVQAVGVKKIH